MKSITGMGLILFGLCAIANADLVDNFESGDLSRWSLDIYNNWGQVIGWDLVQDGTQVWEGRGGYGLSGGGGGNSVQYLTALNASDVSVSASVKAETVIHPAMWSGLVARYTDPHHFYLLMLTGDSPARDLLTIAKSDNLTTPQGQVAIQWLASTRLPEDELQSWNTLRLDVIGNHLTAYFNNTLYLDLYDSSLTSGSVGLTNAGGVTRFDDFSVIGDTTIAPVPLPGAAILGLVGMGLAGWRLRRQIV